VRFPSAEPVMYKPILKTNILVSSRLEDKKNKVLLLHISTAVN